MRNLKFRSYLDCSPCTDFCESRLQVLSNSKRSLKDFLLHHFLDVLICLESNNRRSLRNAREANALSVRLIICKLSVREAPAIAFGASCPEAHMVSSFHWRGAVRIEGLAKRERERAAASRTRRSTDAQQNEKGVRWI